MRGKERQESIFTKVSWVKGGCNVTKRHLHKKMCFHMKKQLT